jgi:caffeoyl-CoA O-methyltransferase
MGLKQDIHSNAMNFTNEKIENYCVQHSSRPSSLCQEVGRYTQENHPLGRMVCGDLVASFLGFMIRTKNVVNILEIGTFTGYSALAMAESLPKNGKVITIDKNKKINNYAKENWDKSEHGKKIEALFGDAKNVLETIDEKFDLIFIDADKKSYPHYLKKSLEMLSPNGMIIIDNVLWSGKVTDDSESDETTTVLKEFNNSIANDKSLYTTILPIRDGLYLIQKAD